MLKGMGELEYGVVINHLQPVTLIILHLITAVPNRVVLKEKKRD